MKLFVVFCVIVVAVAACAPNIYRSGQEAQLLKYENDNDGLGNYRFAFEQTDGTKHEQRGELKNQGRENESIVIRGTYSWISPDGDEYTVTYTADDNGFQSEVNGSQILGGSLNPGVLASFMG